MIEIIILLLIPVVITFLWYKNHYEPEKNAERMFKEGDRQHKEVIENFLNKQKYK